MIVSSPNVGPDLNRVGPIGLVVVQATSLCNLDCSYCYLPDRQKKRVFELDLLPFRPYGRSGISCIVNQNNGKLLSSTKRWAR